MKERVFFSCCRHWTDLFIVTSSSVLPALPSSLLCHPAISLAKGSSRHYEILLSMFARPLRHDGRLFALPDMRRTLLDVSLTISIDIGDPLPLVPSRSSFIHTLLSPCAAIRKIIFPSLNKDRNISANRLHLKCAESCVVRPVRQQREGHSSR